MNSVKLFLLIVIAVPAGWLVAVCDWARGNPKAFTDDFTTPKAPDNE